MKASIVTLVLAIFFIISGCLDTTPLTPLSSDKVITGFKILNPSVDGIIDQSKHIINVTVPYNIDLKNLTPEISFVGKSIFYESGWPRDFTEPVIYTVTAEDDSIQHYLVIISNDIIRIGDEGPAGGIIFYDKGYYSDGWRYLETSITNLYNMMQWGDYSLNVPGTLSNIGAGLSNTVKAAAVLGGWNSSYYAAKVCLAFNGGGYSDWFLPSKNELIELFNFSTNSGLIELDSSWTSTLNESNYGYAWGFNYYTTNFVNSFDRNGGAAVRPIRRF